MQMIGRKWAMRSAGFHKAEMCEKAKLLYWSGENEAQVPKGLVSAAGVIYLNEKTSAK